MPVVDSQIGGVEGRLLQGVELGPSMVDAACSLLEGRSFDGVSIDEIAARTGVTKGAFYRRFRTKQDLFRLLHSRVFEKALEGWQKFLDPVRWEGAPVDEIVDALVDRLRRVYETQPGLMRAFSLEARLGDDLSVRRRAKRLNRQVEDDLLVLLADRPEVPAPTAEELRARVRMALAALRSVLSEALLFGDEQPGPRVDPDIAVREVKRMIIRYLLG